jgi:hypothetical protein
MFTEHYLGDCYGNATQAARLAGYKGSDHVLSETARANLRNPVIVAHIRARVAEVVADTDALLAEVWRIASAPMNQCMVVTKPATYDSDGTKLDDMHVRLDYASKCKALELLLRYHGVLDGQGQAEPVVKALVGVDVSRI